MNDDLSTPQRARMHTSRGATNAAATLTRMHAYTGGQRKLTENAAMHMRALGGVQTNGPTNEPTRGCSREGMHARLRVEGEAMDTVLDLINLLAWPIVASIAVRRITMVAAAYVIYLEGRSKRNER